MVPGGPNALGVVSLSSANAVGVAAVTGKFQITNGKGLSVAKVSQGAAMSLYPPAIAAAQDGSPSIAIEGLVSYRDGYYYLTASDGGVFVLVGENLENYVGDKVVVIGTVKDATTPSGTPRLTVASIQVNGPTGMSNRGKIIFGSALAAGGAGIGVAIYDALNPASR